MKEGGFNMGGRGGGMWPQVKGVVALGEAVWHQGE